MTATGAVVKKLKRLRNAAFGLCYAGNTVECPCCGGRFRAFRKGGIDRRSGAVCPRCGSMERHRLLAIFLDSDRCALKRTGAVLHIAPEECLVSRLRLLAGERYVSADLRPGRSMLVADVTALPFGDDSFDLIVCNHVLEHVPDDAAAIQELLRVLRPGGLAILQTPFDPDIEVTFEDPGAVTAGQRKAAYGFADHVRLYGRDFTDRLAVAGFEVELCDFSGEMPAGDRALYGVFEDEKIVCCRKPAGVGGPLQR